MTKIKNNQMITEQTKRMQREKLFIYYHSILGIINSASTYDHLDSCNNLINNFERKFMASDYNKEVVRTLQGDLNFVLKNKENEIVNKYGIEIFVN